MNVKQRKILQGALAGIVLTLLFPPFLFGWPSGGYAGLGYGFILSWPTLSGQMGSVHVSLLLVEWLAIAVVSCILWALARDPKAPTFLERMVRLWAGTMADATCEAARIHAAAIERAAEMNAPRPSQMDRLDNH
jgi:hypothetical protein